MSPAQRSPRKPRKPASRPAASNISLRRQNARSEGSADYATKRKELAAIAVKLFNDNGYNATTLAHVGAEAGLDRATLYYYVGSKEELFRMCIEGCLDANLAVAERLLQDAALGAREKITQLVTTIMKSYDLNYPQLYVYIREQMHQVANEPSEWAREIQRKTRRLERIMRDLLEQGTRSSIRKDIDARIAVKALFGMLNWTHRWYRPNASVSAEAIGETFSRIFIEGMQAKD